VRRTLALLVCGLTLAAPWSGCKKSSPAKKKHDSIEHRAGIPIIPRGKVVMTKSKGERYLLEIEARLPITQAVTFYRRQLARENWSDLRVQKVGPGLWGLAARRGMFELTGRIKQLKQGVVTIGFERKVRKRAPPVIPPVPKDVPILKDQILWRLPFFEAPGGRAEIRGTSTHAVGPLRKTLVAALQLKGWLVKRHTSGPRLEATRRITRTLTPETRKEAARKLQQQGWTVKLLSDGKTIDGERKLVYHIDGVGKGARVRLILAYAELKPAHKKSGPSRPTPVADAGTPRPRPPRSANVIPLPKDLTLWPSKEPVLGVKRSDAVHHFSLEHKCTSPAALLKEIRGILAKRGYRSLSGSRPSGLAPIAGTSRSATLLRGKRAVVVIVNLESEICTVQLTLVHKSR